MHVLISNDDGYSAPGIESLTNAISRIAKVSVIAPSRDRSGSSHSLTLDGPLRVKKQGNGFYSVVEGTPTDCVHMGITGFLEDEPDMVVSGINSGANMGDDVLYSGTVAAAIEGRFLGLPAIALSIPSSAPKYYNTAAQFASDLVQNIDKYQLSKEMILNVNVPDIPYSEIKGVQVTRLGQRHKSEPLIKDNDPRGRDIYWIGPPGAEADAGEGTDFYAVANGYISITPLQIDLTQYSGFDSLSKWLDSWK